MRTLLAALVMLAMAAAAIAGEVSFSAQPAAARDGDKVKISFAVSAATDVEVAILNPAGKVVRHLAAGVLGGEKPPPEPLKAGLSQTIEWDGKDDAARPAAGGPFKVRVRAGTGAKLGRIIGFDPYRMPVIAGLATDDQGRLYVYYHSAYVVAGWTSDHVRVFDSAGKYLKTIWPPPADLKPEPAKGLPQATGADLDGGYLYPGNYQTLFPAFFPDPNSSFVLMGNRVADGKLFFMNHNGMRIVGVNAEDGGSSTDILRGRLLADWGTQAALARPGADLVGPWCGAVSPDGKTIYLAGVQGATKGLEFWKKGRIHAIDLVAPPSAVTYAGKPLLGMLQMKTLADVEIPAGAAPREAPYDDWGARMGMAAVHGLDTDKDGNVYACDRAANCVAVFDPAGKPLGKAAVTDPDQVAVHPKTGAIYVLTRTWRDKGSAAVSLVKLSGWKDGGKEVARLSFDQPARQVPSLALDSSSEPPAAWVAGIGSRGGLVKLVEQGNSFQKALDLAAKANADALGVAWLCWVNPVTDEVFVNDGWAKEKEGFRRYDGKTGRRLPATLMPWTWPSISMATSTTAATRPTPPPSGGSHPTSSPCPSRARRSTRPPAGTSMASSAAATARRACTSRATAPSTPST